MTIQVTPHSFFIFDLDDTLYPEIEFLKSGYRFIGSYYHSLLGKDISAEILDRYFEGKNAFEWVLKEYGSSIPGLTMMKLLKLYREHKPDISLYSDAQRFLSELAKKNIPAGLITDGRSITQRNKLTSLGIKNYFRDIIISEEFGSEKPDSRNYEYFVKKYPGSSFCSIGDNTTKDFMIPKKLGWSTICIANKGTNIHPQRFNEPYAPQYIVSSFNDIIIK